MNVLIKDSTQSLINALLERGEEFTSKFLTEFFNRHIDSFNEFIKKCSESYESDAYTDGSYTIVEFNVGDSSTTTNMICINYTFSTTKNNKNEPSYHRTTHAYIDLNCNKLKFFQFGPNKVANKEHQEWLDEMLAREWKFFQLDLD